MYSVPPLALLPACSRARISACVTAFVSVRCRCRRLRRGIDNYRTDSGLGEARPMPWRARSRAWRRRLVVGGMVGH